MFTHLDLFVQQQRLEEHYREAEQYRLLQEAQDTLTIRNGKIAQAVVWFGQALESLGQRITAAGNRLEQPCFDPGQIAEVPCE